MSFLKKPCVAALVLTLVTIPIIAVAAEAEIADAATTAVSYKRVCVTVPPFTVSANIAIPVMNKAVHMMVSGDVSGSFPGIAEATIIRNTNAAALQWIAMDYASSYLSSSGFPNPSIGLSSTPGTHILFADDNGNLGVEVASATQVNVANSQFGNTETVCLTFMW